jgi:hypothetical protein
MEPLHRTSSHESPKSRRSSSSASYSHPLSSSLLDHTAPYADPDRTRLSSAAVKRASISMPLESNPRLHVSPQARRPSRANSEHNLLTTVLQAHIMASSNLPDSSAIIDDNDATPTQTHSNNEPILLAPPRQDTDDSSRSSFSLYQLGSALYDRALGAVSTASSVAGSETDGVSTLVSLCLSILVHLCPPTLFLCFANPKHPKTL